MQGCATQVETVDIPVATDSEYSVNGGMLQVDGQSAWWLELDDSMLHALIEKSLFANLSVRQGVARLQQAIQLQKQQGAALLPPVSAGYGYTERKESGSSRDSTSEANLSISWEVDLWGKLQHEKKAAEYLTDAAVDEIRDIALLMSFEIAENYFELVTQKLERRLLESQVEINRKFLQLTELRFANGSASIVDVYQQRQLLTGRKADIYLVNERIVALENRLHVLAGKIPGRETIATSDALPQLPKLPGIGLPADLLQNRPDLRKLQNQLSAAQHEAAAAIAARLPQLRIGGSLGIADADFFHRFFLDAFAPILDWDERKSEAERKRAEVEEQANEFALAYISAVEEVENSLWRETYHLSLLDTLKKQLQLASDTLRESRNRYMQGLTDYLPVLAALQTFQNLENEYLQRRFELVRNRLVLNKALGGNVTGLDQVSPNIIKGSTDSRDRIR